MNVYLVNLSGHTLYVANWNGSTSSGTSWSGTVKPQTIPSGSAKMYVAGELDNPSSGKNWGWIWLSLGPGLDPLLQLYVRNNSSGALDYAVQFFDEGQNDDGATLVQTRAELYGDDVKLTIDSLELSWLGKLRNAQPGKMLHQITIPGSHDSATYTLAALSKCQGLSIEAQLLIGVRYFDIRVDMLSADLHVVHGPAPTIGNTSYSIEDVARIFRRFLSATNETLIVQIKVDRGDLALEKLIAAGQFIGLFPDGKFDRHKLVLSHLANVFTPAYQSMLYLKPIRIGFSAIPTLKDLERKLVVLRRYEAAYPDSIDSATPVDWFATGSSYTANSWSLPTNPANWDAATKFEWPDGEAGKPGDNLGYLNRTTFQGSDYRNRHGLSFVIQDKYGIDGLTTPSGGSVSDGKFALVKTYLEACRNGYAGDSWFLNFSSGSEYNTHPVDYATPINNLLKGYLMQNPPPRPVAGCGVGTILMDFVDAELARMVIAANSW